MSKNRKNGLTYFVAHDASEKTLIKWYRTFAQGLDYHTVRYGIADSVEDAITRIRQNETAS